VSSDEALNILGLESNAKASEIKGAYRDLVKVWHPDRFGNDLPLRRKAEEHLKQINLAYQCLQGYIPANDPMPPKTQRSEAPPNYSAPRETAQAGKYDDGRHTDSANSQPGSPSSPPSVKLPEVNNKHGFPLLLWCVCAVAVIVYLRSNYADYDAQHKSVSPVITKDTYNAGHAPMTLEEAFSAGQHPSSTKPNLSKKTNQSALPSKSLKDSSYVNGLPTFEQRTKAIADRLASIKADPRYQALPEDRKAKVIADLYKKCVIVAYSDFHRPVPDENAWVETNR